MVRERTASGASAGYESGDLGNRRGTKSRRRWRLRARSSSASRPVLDFPGMPSVGSARADALLPFQAEGLQVLRLPAASLG